MSPELLHYGTYFLLTLALSTLFAMGGVGAAVALVPAMAMLGMPLNLAKAIGLFVNSVSTITVSVMNFWRGLLDIRFALPLAAALLVATPAGAWLSRYVPQSAVQWLLAAFMLVSAFLLVSSRREAKVVLDKTWILVVLGGSVGLVSGLVGVGGGTPILAVLVLLGFNAKKAAYAVSFVIPFSTLGGFATYLAFAEMDWTLLSIVSVAAALGGYLGGRIMVFHLSALQVRRFIALLLLGLALKMMWDLLRG